MKAFFALLALLWLLFAQAPARAADIGHVTVLQESCTSLTIGVSFKPGWKDSPRPNRVTYKVYRVHGASSMVLIHQTNDPAMDLKNLTPWTSYNLMVEALSRRTSGGLTLYRKVGEITKVTPQCGASPVQPGAVRLRHELTGKCIFGNPVDGGPAKTFTCWNDPEMAIFLDPLGGQQVRIRLQLKGKCLYAEPANGGTVRNFTCWDDPAMVFLREELGNNRVRFRHKNSGQCMYGSTVQGGAVRNWGCWADPNMVWVIDPF